MTCLDQEQRVKFLASFALDCEIEEPKRFAAIAKLVEVENTAPLARIMLNSIADPAGAQKRDEIRMFMAAKNAWPKHPRPDMAQIEIEAVQSGRKATRAILVGLVLLFAAIATSAFAHDDLERDCRPWPDMVEYLAEDHSETHLIAGFDERGAAMAVFASASGTWSLVFAGEDKIGCIYAAGTNFMMVDMRALKVGAPGQ